MKDQLIKADIQNMLHEAGIFRSGERIVLISGNCVLLEYFTGKMYSYRMVELSCLKPKHLFSKAAPISEKDHQRVIDRMAKYHQYSEEGFRGKESEVERAVKFLVHLFRDVLPRYEMVFRENQLSLALKMLQAVQEDKLALCEAEVGTGKTHAYILAVVVHKLFSNRYAPTIISTSTLALQKAIVEEYLPQISAILTEQRIIEQPLRYVVRKGKSHYVCDSRLKTYLLSLIYNNREEEQTLIETLHHLFSGHDNIDLDEIPVTDYVKRKICVERCHRNCEYVSTCRYHHHIRVTQSGNCDFQIANHNLVLADIIAQKAGRRSLLPVYGVLIFDEAHKLPEVARQMYGMEFRSDELELLIDSIYQQIKYVDSGRHELYQLCSEIQCCNQILFQKLSLLEKDSALFCLSYENRILLERITTMLRRISVLLYTVEQDKYYSGSLLARIEQKQSKLLMLVTANESIVWIEKEGLFVKVCALPRQLDFLLYRDMWDRKVPHILTSGTLSVNGDFGHYKNQTGISFLLPERELEISKRSPFDYQNHALLYLPKSLPLPETGESHYIDTMIEQISELITYTYGHTLVLFTSYRMMELSFRRLSEQSAGFPLFMMGKGRLDAIKQFRHSRNGVLLASDSAGEGIDLPGDLLSSLIIVKLPFPVPDPVLEYEQTLYANFHEYFKAVIMPMMLIKLRQWIGRGIRRESDTCVFSILDSRAGTKYRKEILTALPDMPVTDSIEDVGRFIREHKGDTYFHQNKP